ncbi:22005_t:CDS:2, partial [Racocetra persica]
IGGVLGDSWYLVLETLQLVHYRLFSKYSNKKKNRRINMHHTKSESVTSLTSQITSCSSSSSLNQTTTPLIVQISCPNPFEATDNYPQPSDHVSQAETPIVSYSGSFKDELNTCGIQLNEEFQVAGQELIFVDNYIHKPITLGALRVINHKKFFTIKILHSATILNMHRMIACDPTLIWDLVTSHLIITTNHISTPHHIRIQACKVLANIIVSTVNYVSLSQIKNNERIQSQLLISLYHMIDNSEWISLRSGGGVYVEVQKIRLETLYKVLETSGRAGYSFTFWWNVILDIIKSVCVYAGSGETMENDAVSDDSLSILDESIFYISDTKTSGLVLVAFPSLQLIYNDLLSLLSPKYLKELINTLGAFGLQRDDLYISLKSIGLLWNISEFIQVKRSDHNYDIGMIKSFALDTIDIDKTILKESTSIMDVLWMLLLSQLLKICSDARPEVRNLAIQTVIRSVAVYGQYQDLNQDLNLASHKESHKEFDGFLF